MSYPHKADTKDLLTAEKLSYVHSDIRGDLYEETLRMASRGENVLRLNTGNPGAFGFTMPDSIKNAILENLERSVSYCDFRGMQSARAAICAYRNSIGAKNITEDDIYITNGVSEGVTIICLSLLNDYDEVLLPSPCYTLWSNSVRIAGAKTVYYRCDEENEWNPDIDDIRSKITNNTKAIVIINPNNPTGAVYSKETMDEIFSLCAMHNIIVFSDEIYDRLIYDEKEFHTSASIAPDGVTVITTNGLSKSHSICGLRGGWFDISSDEITKNKIKDALNKICSMRLCANSLMQLLIPAALADEKTTKDMIIPGGRLYEQRKATMEAIENIEGLSCVMTKASFYCFPRIDTSVYNITDDHDFCLNLLHHKKILLIPGSSFEHYDKCHFRIVMLPDAKTLSNAVYEIGDELKRYKR